MDDVDKTSAAAAGHICNFFKEFHSCCFDFRHFFILDMGDVDKATPHLARSAAADRALLQLFQIC